VLELGEALHDGDVEILGRMPWSSNATFLVEIGESRTRAIYKPGRGERPLHDFPPDVFRREIAAYELSRHLGFDLIPPTIERDGPYGTGSMQAFIDTDYDIHYFTLRDDPAHRSYFQHLCAFDIVTNNTDRKGGHCLLDANGRVWAIDNGLSFHRQFKLRTVIWDYAGESIPEAITGPLNTLVDEPLPKWVSDFLDPFERDALLTRTRALLDAGEFPYDETGWGQPWPLV
jgi:uncharacterized repeat protein (TIGR03843 family)